MKQMSQTKAKASTTLETDAALGKADADNATPQGTMTILIGYAVVIVALWGHMFLTMLQRGVR